MSGSHHSLVAVSSDSQREKLLNALMHDANDYDTIFVESIERGYSRIKEVIPELVILFSEIEDVAACQLLSMLAIDVDLFMVPVVTCVPRLIGSECDDEDIVAESVGKSSRLSDVIQMN